MLAGSLETQADQRNSRATLYDVGVGSEGGVVEASWGYCSWRSARGEKVFLHLQRHWRGSVGMGRKPCCCCFFLINLFILIGGYFTILWWFLPYIHMDQPWVYRCSPSWAPLPPPSPSRPSGSSQCTSPEHPVSCIKPGLAIYFIYDNIHGKVCFISQNAIYLGEC